MFQLFWGFHSYAEFRVGGLLACPGSGLAEALCQANRAIRGHDLSVLAAEESDAADPPFPGSANGPPETSAPVHTGDRSNAGLADKGDSSPHDGAEAFCSLPWLTIPIVVCCAVIIVLNIRLFKEGKSAIEQRLPHIEN